MPGLEVVASNCHKDDDEKDNDCNDKDANFVCSGEERHPGSSQDIGGGERKGGGGSWS